MQSQPYQQAQSSQNMHRSGSSNSLIANLQTARTSTYTTAQPYTSPSYTSPSYTSPSYTSPSYTQQLISNYPSYPQYSSPYTMYTTDKSIPSPSKKRYQKLSSNKTISRTD